MLFTEAIGLFKSTVQMQYLKCFDNITQKFFLSATKATEKNDRAQERERTNMAHTGAKWLKMRTKLNIFRNNDPIDLKLVSFDLKRKKESENHHKNYILTTFLCFLADLLNSNFLKTKKH